MAHHHQAPNHSHDEERELGDVKHQSSAAMPPNHNHASGEVKKEEGGAPPHEKRKSIFDYQIAGFAWPFFFLMSLIAIAVLGMVLKVMGMF